jgi:hypothetical protein
MKKKIKKTVKKRRTIVDFKESVNKKKLFQLYDLESHRTRDLIVDVAVRNFGKVNGIQRAKSVLKRTLELDGVETDYEKVLNHINKLSEVELLTKLTEDAKLPDSVKQDLITNLKFVKRNSKNSIEDFLKSYNPKGRIYEE